MLRAVFCPALLLLAALIGCGTSGKPSHPADHIVFRSEDGRTITFGDLAAATGELQYEVASGVEVPEQARALHREARQLGTARDYDKAIEKLAEAQSLAPEWPYPAYDTAATYLVMEDFSKAREFYDKTVKMCPRGFYEAITALDTLDREAEGELPRGTFAVYSSLLTMDDPTEKIMLVDSMIARAPKFAPAWKEYALQRDTVAEKLDAIEKGLSLNPEAETKGALLVQKAMALFQQGDQATALKILGKLALDPNTTLANEHLAKQSLVIVSQ